MAIDPRQIELTPDQKRVLAEKAEQTGKPWAELFDDAVRTYRLPRSVRPAGYRGRSFFDAMVQDGAIGVVKDGLPNDLATNPNHMEGFGRDHNARID